MKCDAMLSDAISNDQCNNLNEKQLRRCKENVKDRRKQRRNQRRKRGPLFVRKKTNLGKKQKITEKRRERPSSVAAFFSARVQALQSEASHSERRAIAQMRREKRFGQAGILRKRNDSSQEI